MWLPQAQGDKLDQFLTTSQSGTECCIPVLKCNLKLLSPISPCLSFSVNNCSHLSMMQSLTFLGEVSPESFSDDNLRVVDVKLNIRLRWGSLPLLLQLSKRADETNGWIKLYQIKLGLRVTLAEAVAFYQNTSPKNSLLKSGEVNPIVPHFWLQEAGATLTWCNFKAPGKMH